MVSGVGWPQYNSSCRTLSTSSSPMSGPGGKGDSNIQGSVRTIGGDGSPPGQHPAILHGPRSRRRPSYDSNIQGSVRTIGGDGSPPGQLYCMGPEAGDVLATTTISDADRAKYETVS